uniref:TIR domain-containing protein n=1 Tax=Strigamia maritima TaxID=126957 RepID=T1JLB7_STRMM
MDLECRCQKNGLIFKQNSTRPFQFQMTFKDDTLNLTGRCDDAFKVQDVLRMWAFPLSTLITMTKMMIIVDYFHVHKDKIRSYFDFNSFPRLDSVVNLEFIDKCSKNVRGNISEFFPNLNNLRILLHRLKKVPENMKMMPRLRKMDLRSNEIEAIDQDDFQGLPELQNLEMSRNEIRILPDGFLNENSNLELLRLGYNKLTSVPGDLLKNKPKLSKFELHYNQLKTLPENLLDGVTNLYSLALKGNKLRSFPPNFFQNVKIESLYLYDNLLTQIPHVKHVKYINLKGNNISHLILPLSDVIPTAETILLSDNCIRSVTSSNSAIKRNKKMKFECVNCCFDSIPVELAMEVGQLNISDNKITKFGLDELKKIYFEDNSVNLVLTNNNITRINTDVYQFIQENPIFDFSSNANMIELRGNPFVCDCHLNEILKNDLVKRFMNKVFDVEFWRCHDSITGSDVKVDDLNVDGLVCDVLNCPNKCKCLENRAKQHFRVNCSGAGLNEFPTNFSIPPVHNLLLNLDNNNIKYLPSRTWAMWIAVEELDLSRNKLESVKNLTFSDKLTNISLRFNYLTQLEPPILKLFTESNVRTVWLARNHWKCSCDMRELRNLAVKSKTDFADRQDTRCMVNENDKVSTFDLYDVDDFCTQTRDINTNNAGSIVWPIVAVIVIIVSVLVILSIRFKLEIKYFLFAKGWCLGLVTEEDIDAAKQYDAFVSYSSADGEWVRDVLVAGLEEGQPAYKLCLHERDWLAGEFIPEQIVLSVQESRRTIIVLTPDFLSSAWSQIEFNVAYHKAFEDRVRRLIVVVPKEMPKLDMARDDLRAFLATTTYLEASKPHFWTKLRCSMPRIRPKDEMIL